MRLKIFSLIFLVCFFSSCNFPLNATNEIAKKKAILAQRKILRAAAIKQINSDKENYDSLCNIAFFYLTDAIIERDIGDLSYKKDIETALDYYNKAIAKNKEGSSAYMGLFFVYDFIRDEKNALENIMVAIEKDKNDADAPFILGNFYYKKADYQNALPWIRQALKLTEGVSQPRNDSWRKGLMKMIAKAEEELKRQLK